MGKKQKTTEEFKQEVYDLVGDEFTVLGNYVKSNTKILMRHNCERCNNHEFEIEPTNFKQRKTCPVCSRLKQYDAFRKTTKDFKKEVYDLVENEYTVLGEYITRNTKILMRHNCEACNNHEFEMLPGNFLSGQRCPDKKCKGVRLSESQRMTLDEFKQRVYDDEGDNYSVLGDQYINAQTKILMRHNCERCNNHEFEMRPAEFMYGKNRCPKCKTLNASERQIKTLDEFKQEVYTLVGNEYTILGEYSGGHNYILMRHNCERCNNHEWNITPHNFLQNHRCPVCALNGGVSKEEIELRKFIESVIVCKDKSESRKILPNNKDIDILTSLNIGFEYNGLYWHSEQFVNKKYHLNKTIDASNMNINLIHIFSDEWNYKSNIIKSKIKTILKVNNSPKIYARKCTIKEIQSNEKNKFLNENHIQGEDKALIKLGLYYNDNLVSVMTFCKPRQCLGLKNSEYDYELSRFASNINYIVVGAFSKLFRYFERNYNWNKIITYADRRWSVGKVYLKNGWIHIHDTKPNYWYTDGFKRYHRYGFRKQVLKEKFPNLYDENLTEFQIMDKTSYKRIWDCGNMVFEYTRKS